MPRWPLRHWYLASAAIAMFIIVLALVMRDSMSTTRMLMLLNLAVFNLQLVEKFGWPGGFAGLSDAVADSLGQTRLRFDSPGQAMTLGGWLGLFVLLPPVLFPDRIWLVMSSVIFGFLEVLGHSTVVGSRPGPHYNPGLAVALLGYVPVGLAFLGHAYDIGIQITLLDWGLGLLIPLGGYAAVLGLGLAEERRRAVRHPGAADPAAARLGPTSATP